jgi:ketopantoate hydroxymethyltransferase
MKIDALKIFKNQGKKITCLTAYDASFASVFDKCGVDIILVGDSLGNVIKGDVALAQSCDSSSQDVALLIVWRQSLALHK